MSARGTIRKIVTAPLLCVALSGCGEPDARPSGARPDPVWSWSDDRIREFWGRIEAGPSLRPASWPDGARVAVALSFDFQMGTIYDQENVASSVNTNSQYDGRAGLPRLLSLLARHDVPASFFVTGVTAMLYPDRLRLILDSGPHEIGVHGWIHERPSELTEREERRLMAKALEAIEAVTGQRPVGYRSPAWQFSEHTLDLLVEVGFLYDSGMMADDDPYEIVAGGESTGLVEIPVEWIRDDAPHFRQSGASSPVDVYDIWSAEFDRAYEEGGLFQLTMHPRIMGHRSRVELLEKLILHIKSHDGVWFGTHEGVARYVKERAHARRHEGGEGSIASHDVH